MSKKAQNKLLFKEGDWFAVPLTDGGFAVGLVARSPKGGKVLFGYFFGPRRFELPKVEDLRGYSPSKALLVAIFGDYSLYRGEWPILGNLGNWKRDDWPMPLFSRVDEKGKAVKVKYSENDPTDCATEMPCSIEEAKDLPEDSMKGSHIVARHLSKLLPK
jgi:hypothetical protein